MRPILGALTATDKAAGSLGVPLTLSDPSPIVGPSESLPRANPADHKDCHERPKGLRIRIYIYIYIYIYVYI
jgi:hypothetical protein